MITSSVSAARIPLPIAAQHKGKVKFKFNSRLQGATPVFFVCSLVILFLTPSVYIGLSVTAFTVTPQISARARPSTKQRCAPQISTSSGTSCQSTKMTWLNAAPLTTDCDHNDYHNNSTGRIEMETKPQMSKETETEAKLEATEPIEQPGNGDLVVAVSPSSALDHFLSFCAKLTGDESDDESDDKSDQGKEADVQEEIHHENRDKIEDDKPSIDSQLHAPNDVRIISRGSKIPKGVKVVSINSVLFLKSVSDDDENVSSYSAVIVVLSDQNRVDVDKLKDVLSADDVLLAPSSQVEAICGFAPGTVPPFGHYPNEIQTIVDQSLVHRATTSANVGGDEKTLLLGGGGHVYWQSLISIDTLLGLECVQVEDVSTREQLRVNGDDVVVDDSRHSIPARKSTTNDEKKSTYELLDLTDEGRSISSTYSPPKPYFPIAPPPTTVAQRVIEQRGLPNPLLPEWVTVVGRIGGVRQVAKQLVFCDLLPPAGLPEVGQQEDEPNFPEIARPWRSPVDGGDISVQLIAGKSLCRRLGSVAGEQALKQIKTGQLLLIHAKTNVGLRGSLENWVHKRNLDLIVFDYTLLMSPQGAVVGMSGVGFSHKHRPKSHSLPTGPTLPVLALEDLFSGSITRQPLALKEDDQEGPNVEGEEGDKEQATETADASVVLEPPKVILVDNMASAKSFASDFVAYHELVLNDIGSDNFSRLSVANPTINGETKKPREHKYLVGIDCEWKPNYLLEYVEEKQPVLLMQLSFHDLRKVYLIDMQSLFRPSLPSDEAMNDVEALVSATIGHLFLSKHIVKVGYQLASDLRKVASSYPHVPSFQMMHGMLELSTLVKRVLHMTKQKQSRTITMSLARLAAHYLRRGLDKTEQVSDWSHRPLSQSQQMYAAMDAAVLPVLTMKALDNIKAYVYPVVPRIERWEGDDGLSRGIFSWRLLFLHGIDDMNSRVIRKLHAKKAVGNEWSTVQEWVTGTKAPSLPTVPKNSRATYTDLEGTLCVPSSMISLQDSMTKSLSSIGGIRCGKSKDRCLRKLLDFADLPEGAKVDFPQRSGCVAFQDGVALFVSMPERSGLGQPRSYPNEWLEGGKVLTWFLRSSEWNNGTTNLAKTMQNDDSPIVLFVRVGKGQFVCCGNCRVQNSIGEGVNNNWGLVQLNLELINYDSIAGSQDFEELVNMSRRSFG